MYSRTELAVTEPVRTTGALHGATMRPRALVLTAAVTALAACSRGAGPNPYPTPCDPTRDACPDTNAPTPTTPSPPPELPPGQPPASPPG